MDIKMSSALSRIIIFISFSFVLASCGSDSSNKQETSCLKTKQDPQEINAQNTSSNECKLIVEKEDSDNDGIIDELDNCINNPNPNQLDTDNDGMGDICDSTPLGPDTDEDGINDDIDNCINNPNPNQLDTDSDDMGDICDSTPFGPDADEDGVIDTIDNCPNIKNENQRDKDSDSIGDLCDNTPLGGDITAPTATILFPPEFSISKEGSVIIRGVTNDATFIHQVNVNGIAAETKNNYESWVVNLDLEQGLNVITVETSDSLNTDLHSDSVQIKITGPSITYPRGMTVDKQNNKIFWIDSFGPLLSANLENNHRFKISIPDGETILAKPRGIILNNNADTAYISDTDLDHIIKFDLMTGQAQVLSTCPSELSFIDEMIFDQEGNRLIVSGGKNQVVAVDLSTGSCSILFSAASSIGGLARDNENHKIYFGNDLSLYSYNEITETKELITNAMQSPLNGHVKHLLYDADRNSIIWLGSNDFYDTDVIYMLENGSDQITVITSNETEIQDARVGFTQNMALSADGQEIVMMPVNSQNLIGINIGTGVHRVVMERFNSEKDQGADIINPAAIDTDGEFAYTIDSNQKNIVKVNLKNGHKEIFLELKNDFSSLTARIKDIRIDKNNHQLYIMTDVDVIPDKDYLNDFLPEFIKVDLATKMQTTISSARDIGDEPDLHYADDFELDLARNRILVIDTTPDEIVEIDISTGERIVFSGDSIPNNSQEFSQIKHSVMDINNDRLLVTDSAIPSLVAIDLKTGNRTTFSERAEAQGILTIDNSNQLLYSLRGSTIYKIELQSKEIVTISDWSNSNVPNKLAAYDEITYSEYTNLLYVTDDTSNVIFVIDPETGARVILSK
ncbi:MAG: DNA-binding beta-propeller fold protein YncE [Oleispira sp.]|jgi:DNA-binding beta-propeller fold protein YncE